MLQSRGLSKAVVSTLVAVVISACGTSYYEKYAAEHPDWKPDLPSKGMTLEETVAALHAPGPTGSNTALMRIELLQVTPGVSTPISLSGLQSGAFRSSAEMDYGVIALVSCRSMDGIGGSYGESVSWFVLTKNSLVAWDHRARGRGCMWWQVFEPAKYEQVAVERRVRAHARDHFPWLVESPNALYEKGLALAKIGRVDDAREYLRTADEHSDLQDGGMAAGYRPERSALHSQADRDSARARLIVAIRAAERPEDVVPQPSE